MQKPNMFEAKKRDRKAIIKEEYKTDPKYKNIGNGLKYTVKTYGCQMNEHDSENIKAMLEEMSFTEALPTSHAQKLVHLCDFLSSKKILDVKFDENEIRRD